MTTGVWIALAIGTVLIVYDWRLATPSDPKTKRRSRLKPEDRKRLFDMAMEMHALQPSATLAGTAHASLTRQINELATTIGKRDDVPGDVKASFESFKKELEAIASRLVAPAGRGGGGGRGMPENMAGKIGQAKTGLMGFMSPGDQTLRAYAEVKAQMPKAIADFSAVVSKAATLSTALAQYKLTLTVPTRNW